MTRILALKDIGVKGTINANILGQLAPADTNAASIYSPPNNIYIAEINKIIVCNSSGGALSYRIFIDEDGSTYSAATALYYDKALPANDTHIITLDVAMNNMNGNLAVRSSSANNISFSVFGTEALI